LSPRWFRGGRGSDESDDSIDEQLSDGIEPMRSVALGGESGSWSLSRGRRNRSADRGQRRPAPARAAQSGESGSWESDEWVQGGDGDSTSTTNPVPRSRSASPRGRIAVTILAVIVLPIVTLFLVVNHQEPGTQDTSASQTPDAADLIPSLPDAFPPGTGAPGGLPGADPTPSAVPTPSAGPSPSAPAAPPATPPASARPAQPVIVRVPLHTLQPRVVANGPSGQRTVGMLGSTSFPNSVSVFVSCSEQLATLTYTLDGRYVRLTATAGLTGDATPGDLVTRLLITGDGRALASVEVSLDRTAPISVNLTGVRSLVVAAQRERGTCRNSNQPYGVLGTAVLQRR
jgi:hypothetical protein